MKEIIKEKSSKHIEFEKLLDEDLAHRTFKEGTIIPSTVTAISKKWVWCDMGLKSECAISISEFQLTKQIDSIKVGSKIDILLEKIEHPRFGEPVASFEKAKKVRSWRAMQTAFENNSKISGVVVGRVKGGYAVSVDSFLAFLPGSQAGTKKITNDELSHLMKEPHTYLVCKIDKRRMNVILSRKQVLEEALNKNREKEIAKLKEGMIIDNATCKTITPWGAFFSFGSLELLVHINECSWSRISTPGDLLTEGQTSRVKIIKIEGTRLSGSIKQLQPDPFIEAANKYKPGQIVKGIISSVKDYGAFCNIEPNLTGLIHQTEMDHLNKNIHPAKVFAVSQSCSVQILSISVEDRKLSLSYKNTFPSPWISFKEKFKKDSVVSCHLKSKTDYAAFLLIEDTPITGMLHLNDVTYDASKKEKGLERYNKKDILKCKIIEVDEENMRVRLSLKHLEPNPFDFFKDKKVNSIITATVDSVNKKGDILVYPGNNKKLKILIKKGKSEKDEITQTSRFTPGMRVDCMITELRPEKNKVTLSVKAAEQAQGKEMLKKYGSAAIGTGQVLGDILGKALKLKDKKKPKTKK